ncbi:MAG: TrmH family RNA methyltransferase [Treponema sp.]|nr:TrmH family RNA methyltransferase [Treponema sp.]
MIPLYKLDKLPRTQKLRKIAKIFTMAENRLFLAVGKGIEIFSSAELVFFESAVRLLSQDSHFSPEKQKVFAEAAGVFSASDDVTLFRRALNSIKHILLTETGKEQADWDFTGSDGKLNPEKRQVFEGMHVYMEDIRSPFNVGAMFRTAESFGVEKIILSPFCADPRHRRAERTAMGCIDVVPWERRELFASETAEQEALPIFALETGGTPLDEFPFPKRGLLIAGSEELGVSPRALAAADASLGRVSIPCYGTKASLNVSVAFGIALQYWRSKMHA